MTDLNPTNHHTRTIDTTDRMGSGDYIGLRCGYCEDDTGILYPAGGVAGFFCNRCGQVAKIDRADQTTEVLREPDTDDWQELHHKVLRAHGRMTNALHDHNPSLVVGAFSGGHDSLVATHIASQHPGFDGALHINTGIGVAETRQFVRQACDYFGWTLYEYAAKEHERADGTPDPQVYEDFVRERGFPGPAKHWKMYNRLKLRPIEQFIREQKEGRYDRIMMCSGRRRQESARRMNIEDAVEREGARLWVQPILEWSGTDCRDYIDQYLLPQNRVVDLLCMSGECLCGAFAKDGEMEALEACFPSTAERIRDLEKEIDHPWGWEERPPSWWVEYKKGQEFLPGMAPDDDARPMCTSCEFQYEQRQELEKKREAS